MRLTARIYMLRISALRFERQEEISPLPKLPSAAEGSA